MKSLAFDIRSRSAVVLAAAFVVWSVVVMYGHTEWFDYPVYGHLTDSGRTGVFDLFMRSLTEIGDVFYMLGFSILLIIIRPTRRVGITLIVLLVLTTLFTGYIKCGIDRERPEPDEFVDSPLEYVRQFFQSTMNLELDQFSSSSVKTSPDTFSLFCSGGFDASYPSGHSARAAAIGAVLAIALAGRFPRLAPFLLLYPAMMAVSRVYVLQHYPSDVIGGILLGILLAGIVSKKTRIDCSKSKTL